MDFHFWPASEEEEEEEDGKLGQAARYTHKAKRPAGRREGGREEDRERENPSAEKEEGGLSWAASVMQQNRQPSHVVG